jgi:hypothetical protein
MLGQQSQEGDTTTARLISITDEAITALNEALGQEPDAPRNLRLYFQGFG